MQLSPENAEILSKAFRPLDLNIEDHSEFFDFWEVVEAPKFTYLTREGQIERYFYVVIKGVQCVYIIDREGTKKIIGFSFDGSFSGIYDSFMKAKPSAYFLETLTDSVMMRINQQDFLSLFEKYPEFEHWGRVVHLELLMGRVQREVELTTKTAKERFEIFMDRCPEQLLLIPQKYLASYLNMTPETFSRMRKERV